MGSTITNTYQLTPIYISRVHWPGSLWAELDRARLWNRLSQMGQAKKWPGWARPNPPKAKRSVLNFKYVSTPNKHHIT